MKRSDIIWGVFTGMLLSLLVFIAVCFSLYLIGEAIDNRPSPKIEKAKNIEVKLDPTKRYDVTIANEGATQIFRNCSFAGWAKSDVPRTDTLGSIVAGDLVLQTEDSRKVVIKARYLLSIVETDASVSERGV